jgi:hypothetical protein
MSFENLNYQESSDYMICTITSTTFSAKQTHTHTLALYASDKEYRHLTSITKTKASLRKKKHKRGVLFTNII